MIIAASIKIGVLLASVLKVRALPFDVHNIGPRIFGNSPIGNPGNMVGKTYPRCTVPDCIPTIFLVFPILGSSLEVIVAFKEESYREQFGEPSRALVEG